MSLGEAAVSGAKPVADKKVAISGGLLALALGSGLGATPAEATLVTTPLDVTVQAGGSYSFGPNGDEFTVTNNGLQDVFGAELQVVTLQGNVTALSKNFVAVKSGGPGPFGQLLDFYGPGDHINDASSTFDTSGNDIFFKPASNIIYGLKSVDVTDPFGYVQLDVLGNTDLHLDKFVFETDPNATVTVVPEPGTLSLFAAGGAALLAARRRKKQKKTA
jgi:hypothetical protein